VAKSGTISLSVTGLYGISGWISWEETSVNTTANTSVVTVKLHYKNPTGAATYSSVADPPFYIIIDGNKKQTSTGATISAYSNDTVVLTHTVTVTHNSNGSRSVAISAGGGLSGTGGLQNSYGSGTATLTSIVRGKPTASLSVSPYNSNTVVKGWGVYVRGFSQIDYSISGTPYSGSGATISNYEFQGNGQTIKTASGRTNTINTYGTLQLNGYVKDSRGIWSDASTKSVLVYDYASPKVVSASAYRSDSSGDGAASGTHITMWVSASVGATVGGRNSISEIAYNIRDNDSKQLIESGSLTNGSVLILDNYDTDKSYLVTFSVKDTIGTATQRTVVVSKAITTLHLGENGLSVAVGTDATKSRSFEIAPNWSFYFKGKPVADFVTNYSNVDGWEVEEHASGRVFAFRSDTITADVKTSTGSLYCSSELSASLPTGVFSSLTFVDVKLIGGTNYLLNAQVTGASANQGEFTYSIISSWSHTSSNRTAWYFVVGWK
jgi:hypothetical protein